MIIVDSLAPSFALYKQLSRYIYHEAGHPQILLSTSRPNFRFVGWVAANQREGYVASLTLILFVAHSCSRLFKLSVFSLPWLAGTRIILGTSLAAQSVPRLAIPSAPSTRLARWPGFLQFNLCDESSLLGLLQWNTAQR